MATPQAILSGSTPPTTEVDISDQSVVVRLSLDGNPDPQWCRLLSDQVPVPENVDDVVVRLRPYPVLANEAGAIEVALRPDVKVDAMWAVLDWLPEALQEANRLRQQAEGDAGRLRDEVDKWWRQNVHKSAIIV